MKLRLAESRAFLATTYTKMERSFKGLHGSRYDEAVA
jgi:hypothetical protein